MKMENMNLKMWNKLIDSAEGLEVNLKVGKQCELNVKGNFVAIAKLYGIILEKESIESREREENNMKEFKSELGEYLNQVK
jgi:hypothetical protein